MAMFTRRRPRSTPAGRAAAAVPVSRAASAAAAAPVRRLPAEAEPAARVGPAWGWKGAGGGRAAHVEAGALFQATTVQACGLFPYVQGSGAPAVGVPIGRHMLTGESVALELLAWARAGLITNTGAFLLGQPGTGKSTIAKRLCTGCAGFGMPPFIPADVKGEYSAVIEHLGGQVVRVGRGLNKLNPLDSGPLGRLARTATGALRAELLEEMNARRLASLSALCTVVRRAPVTDGEEVLLTEAVRLLDEQLEGDPTVPDVLAVLERGPAELRRAVFAADEAGYRAETKQLCWTLSRLCKGPLSGIFDGPSDVDLDLSRPVSVDISALRNQGDAVVAAAMLCSWAWAFAQLDGETALGRRRQRLIVMDEMWRALRAAPGLVERTDQLTRLNRAEGIATLMVTHTLADLEALATEEDRAKARGLVERCGVTIMSALPYAELHKVARVVPLTGAEMALVASWAAPPSWSPQVAHPGRGKYLIKTGERLGIPVQLSRIGAEEWLYDTDQAIREPAHAITGPAGNRLLDTADPAVARLEAARIEEASAAVEPLRAAAQSAADADPAHPAGSAATTGTPEGDSRVELRRRVRQVAAAASGQDDFFARLAAAGVLVRRRYGERAGQPRLVTSYAVALAGATTDATDCGSGYVGGGRLAPDLSWPRLLSQWTPATGPELPQSLTPQSKTPRSEALR